MSTTRMPNGAAGLGLVALLVATGLLGVVVVDAVRVDDVAGVQPAPVEVAGSDRAQDPGEVPALPERPEEVAEAEGVEDVWSDGYDIVTGEPEAIAMAVGLDPFSPAREAPRTRYRLPSMREPVMARRQEEERERPEAPDFRVVGTAVIGGGGAALVQIDDDTPRLLAMGESMSGYRLESIEGESATLVGPAGELRLGVQEMDRPRRDRDDVRDERRARERDQQRAERAARERQQNAQQQIRTMITRIQRARGGGG